jgi:hypothetical protein
MFAAFVVSLLMPAISATTVAEDRANTRLDLVRLSAALAVFRAEHGSYPERLEDLMPDVHRQLPVDLYHERPFVYRLTDDGYLLYCLAENGQDDGGSNEQMRVLVGRPLDYMPEDKREAEAKKIPSGADDITIRVPQPVFEWPKPAAQ